MTTQVLARKWRPQKFSELVGQEHISRTLKNAISRNRIAHAYLFVGSRGVGKTTAARLFAKSLNCTSLQDGEPCCVCESCISITRGNSLDVIEIDGASNNGVDAIRELRENVQYTPATGNYKIYIIDEVHMLSQSAWNALLKTLEEPPTHAKFIFATTEGHKVLATVVSRCQRFDFKSIPTPLIAQKLRLISDAEKIFISDLALTTISRAADGGMRDAQSILDQMISFCGGMNENEMIDEKDVVEVFGIASGSELATLLESLLRDDTSGTMLAISNLAIRGRDLERLLNDLLLMLRNLLIYQTCKDSTTIIGATDDELVILDKISKYDHNITESLLGCLMKSIHGLHLALNKRVYLEVALIQAMHEAHAMNLNKLITLFQQVKDNPNIENIAKRAFQVVADQKSSDQNQLLNTVTAPIVEEVVEKIAEPVVEEPVVEEIAEPVAEPVVEEIAEPVAEPVVEEIAEPVAEPVVEEIAEPVAEPVVEEIIEPVEEPVVEEVNEPVIEESIYEAIQDVPSSMLAEASADLEISETDTTPFDNSIDEYEASSVEPINYEPIPEPVAQMQEAEPVVELPIVEETTDYSNADLSGGGLDPNMIWNLAISKVSKFPQGLILKRYMQELKPHSIHNDCLNLLYDDDFPEAHVAELQKVENINLVIHTLKEISNNNINSLAFKKTVIDYSNNNMSHTERIESLSDNENIKSICTLFGGEVIDVRG